jgi:hypothetical protein
MKIILFPCDNQSLVCDALDSFSAAGLSVHVCLDAPINKAGQFLEPYTHRDLIILDRRHLDDFFFAEDTSVRMLIADKKIPILVVDDIGGSITQKDFKRAQYPATTAGVIFNEVLLHPAVLKNVVEAIRESTAGGNEPKDPRPGIAAALSARDWGFDPDFTNQYGRHAQPQPAAF